MPAYAQTASTLDTVVVTANRIQETKREVASNMTIVTQEDIQAATGTSLADVLEQQGVLSVVNYGDSKGFQIRGMHSSPLSPESEGYTLMLLNGRRVGNVNPMVTSMANVERVEIIRGPSAVQYGSSALGGVVNVITKKGTNLKPFASVELGIGSDSLQRQKLAFGGSANGFDFAFGGINSSRKDLTTHWGRWYHSDIDKDQSYNADLGYTFAKNHRIGINHNQADIKSNLSTGMGGIRPLGSITPSSAYQNLKKTYENTALSYTGSTDSKNIDWLVNYSFGKNKTQGWDQPGPKLKNSDITTDTEAFNAQVNYHTSLFTLSGGLDQFKYDTSSWSSWNPTVTQKSHIKDTGVYLTGKLRLLNEKLIFSTGLRHDEYRNSDNAYLLSSKTTKHTGGSIGVSYVPMDWLKLRANYAEGFKMPTPSQLSGNGTSILPNLSLNPELSKTWELGTDIYWNNLNGSLTYFHSDYKNKIISLPVPGTSCIIGGNPQLCNQNQNLQGAEIAGFEGAVSYDLGKAFQQNYNLSPYVNFTWLTTRKNKDPRPSTYVVINGSQKSDLSNTPEWMASYGVNFAHPGMKLKTRLNATYYGRTYTADYSQGWPAPWISRPSGTVVNWSLDKELTDFGDRYGKLSLRTEVGNLFNARNEMYWGYPGAGRHFYVGLRYDMK